MPRPRPGHAPDRALALLRDGTVLACSTLAWPEALMWSVIAVAAIGGFCVVVWLCARYS